MSNLEEFTDSRIDLPITSFPPFKLRSSMVDKDPVIWVHLIETYIQYVQLLLSNSTIQLTEKSEHQLQLFVQTYLFEIAEEQGQILSLGLINVQILQNLDSLRVYMFELIKTFGIWRLKLNNGTTLWNFAKIYAPKNRTVVRAIIDGSWKSADTNSRKSPGISSINQVQKFLEQRISNAKFDKYDLAILAALLTPSGAANQSNTGSAGVSKNGKAVKKNSNINRNLLNFNDAFVSVFWIELLEKLYANGSGRFADVCKKIGIVSVTSLNNAAIANLATQLGVTSYHTLELYPLFGGVITSEKFKQVNPGLETKLPFLGKKLRPKKKTKKYGFNKDHIRMLMDFFPSLTISKSETLLKSNNYNVESVTNILLEDPTIIENTPDNIDSESEDEEMEEVPMASQIISKKVNLPARKHQANHVPDELKNKTLEAALRMMYEADEDERDDTYDEAEATAHSTPQKMDKVEKLLFELFKTSQQHFSREERNSKYRKELKAKTKWSDEQIEGWGRMLVKDPRRFRLVEERYMNELVEERNNARRRPQETEEAGEQNSSKQTTNKPDQKNQSNRTTEKRQQARNEKNKASKGNHNRKRGHDKKLRASMPAPV